MLENLNSVPANPSRVIIIGSAGVVGKKLIPYLRQKSIKILPLSRQDCNLLDNQSIDFLAQILQPNDQVVFLAAITPDKGKGIKAFIDNLRIIENVSQAMQKSSVAQFILFSSEAIYPATSNLINEETSLMPEDLYGCMHLSREIHLHSLKIPLLIIRPSLIYGKGDTHNSYGINRFLREAFQDRTITLFGEGAEKRSHVFIEDVVKFLYKVLCYRSVGSVNLCPSSTISFMEIAQIIKEALSVNVKIIKKMQTSRITHRYFDNTFLYQAFPRFLFSDITAGIKKVIAERDL